MQGIFPTGGGGLSFNNAACNLTQIPRYHDDCEIETAHQTIIVENILVWGKVGYGGSGKAHGLDEPTLRSQREQS